MLRPENAGLPFKAKDRPVNIRLARQHGGIVDEIACLVIVGAVYDNVVFAKQVESILAVEQSVIRLDLYIRVNVVQPLGRRLDLGPADIFGAVDYLSLQIGLVNDVKIDQPDSTHTCGGQIKSKR